MKTRKEISNKIRQTGKTLKGGRYLGEGAFGCVISPAIECKMTSTKLRSSRKYKHNNVSKIIKAIDENDDIKTEIAVSNILRKIDPDQRYFIHIKDHCNLKKVPDNRSNISSVRYLDNELSYSRRLNSKKLDKRHCDVDLSLKPVNMILSNGGYDFKDILETYANGKSKATKNNLLEEYKLGELFFYDFKNQFKHLLQGLYKLHTFSITNRDIKKENIMIDWVNSNNVQVRYIDFGLSEILTHSYRSSIYNIHANGTPEFFSPEIVIASILKKYYNYDQNYILSKVFRDLKHSVIQICKELNLDYSNLNNIVKQLIVDIQNDFKNKTILPKFFGTENDKYNGYIQKTDVYALGLSIYEIIYFFSKNNTLKNDLRLNNLLKSMINFEPNKRLNVIQCLQHPYFQ
jgi:serine/threonine protein kinase